MPFTKKTFRILTAVKLGGGCFCVGIWIGNMTCGSPGAT